MENLKATEYPTPNTQPYTAGDSTTGVPTPEPSDVDYKLMAKIIDKQLAKFNRTYVKEVQKQFKKFIRDNRANFDRLSRENRRLLKIVEDLQSSQRHLQHQIELHQEREKLAVLREQQDVKRIRNLEDRLSLFLLAPVDNHHIAIDDPSRSEIAIQQAEIVETVEEFIDETALESESGGDQTPIDHEETGEERTTKDPSDTGFYTEDQPAVSPLGAESNSDFHTNLHLAEDDDVNLSDESGESPDSIPEDSTKRSQLFDGDQPQHLTEEDSVRAAQAQEEPSVGAETEYENVAELIAVEPSPEIDAAEHLAEEVIEPGDDPEAEPGETVTGQASVGEDGHSENESVEVVVDADSTSYDAPFSPINAATPVADDEVQIDSSQIEMALPEHDTSPNREEVGFSEEPSTEEIETVGEMPPLDLESAPDSLSESEDISNPNEEVIETSYDALLYEPDNQTEPDRDFSSEDSVAGAEGGFGIIDGEDKQEEIIELQDEISLEKPGVEMDVIEEAPAEVASATDVEMPGMQLESVVGLAQGDSADTDDHMDMEDDNLVSDDEVDTGSFEIIELQDENIIPPLPDSADFQPLEGEALASEGSTDNLYAEGSGAPLYEPDNVEATGIDLSSDNAQEYFKHGKLACETKDYAQAAVYFDRFVELEPDEPRGHYNLAILYYRLKKYPVAQTHAKRAIALDYTPANKILRKIELKLASEVETMDIPEPSIEDTATEEPMPLNEVVNRLTSPPLDDETLVYEPDILPNFNIDLSENEPTAEPDDEPYELLSPIESESPESAYPELESPGTPPDQVIAENSVESSKPEVLDQGLEMPGMENTDDGSPRESVPVNASLPQAVETDMPMVDTEELSAENIADELPGVTLVEETVAPDSNDAEIESELSPHAPESGDVPSYPLDMFEDLPADAAETIQEADRKEPEIIGNGFTDNDSIGVNDIPEAYQSGTLSGEDMVESSEEAIPANQCFAMAMKASQKRDYPEAIACFEKYIDQLPDEPKGHYNLAILHYRLREYDKASEHANTALQLGAKSSQKIIDKIESKRSQIKPEKPEESGEDALSSLLNDSLNFPTTGLKDPVGHDETASIWDADELDGDISQSLIAEATPENSFDIKDDVIVFNSAMAQDRNRVIPEEVSPANKPSLDDLKISARHHSSRHGAEELVANTGTTVGHDDNGMMPPSENGRVANLFKLGEKAIESKEFLKAIKHFTKVTHLAPEDPRGYYYLALVSCRLKFFETAREHATRAIEMGSEPAKKVLEEINAHQISS